MTKKRKTITVTEADIELAIPRDSGHCAIADAIARQIPEASAITVDLQTIRWSDKARGERYVYLTPRVAQVLLLDFDQGDREYCQPLTFTLGSPVQVVPVQGSRGKVAAARKAARAQRLADLRAKRDRGEEMTRDEKAIVTRADKRDAAPPAEPRPPRPNGNGPRRVTVMDGHEHGDPSGTVTVHGGGQTPRGALAHGQGKTRVFGMKAAGSPQPVG